MAAERLVEDTGAAGVLVEDRGLRFLVVPELGGLDGLVYLAEAAGRIHDEVNASLSGRRAGRAPSVQQLGRRAGPVGRFA